MALAEKLSPCRIDQAKGKRRHRCSHHHADLVEGFRLAQYVQEQRAEAATGGYPTELAAYFGDDGAGDAVEKRLTFKNWLRGHADRTRRDDEVAA